MALSNDEVLHIALLADLALTPDEVSGLASDLGAILAHVEQLNELDTRDVPATAHVAVRKMPLRPDVVVAGLTQAQATRAAPRVSSGAFAVPKFVDE
jgi:aspartyl-tRNA(Asn)/glutamyl-tRNA(Gln) amidotransferase subunit C